MSDARLDYDPLLSEIFTAVMLCGPATASLEAAQEHLPEGAIRHLDELAGRIRQERIFTRKDLALFDVVLAAFDAALVDMLDLRVDYKEFGAPDVYHEYSADGLILDSHRGNVASLRDCLTRIVALRRAEVLALRFRAADAA